MTDQQKVFSFGKNWQNFLSSVDDERIKLSERSLSEFLGLKSLNGLRFLDIGCGSGLFSLAAHNLGAKEVVSFDADPFSVKCCTYLREKVGSPASWAISDASVLDKEFLSRLEKFDIVYSWGVLHHTGDMWRAITNAAELVAPQGYFYIALYNKTFGLRGSGTWWKIKKFYNSAPGFVKSVMVYSYMFIQCVVELLHFHSPFRLARHYKKKRGMDWKTDVIDWIGGYPYEAATVDEVFAFMKEKFPEFRLVNIKSTSGLGNNWFLYQNIKAKH